MSDRIQASVRWNKVKKMWEFLIGSGTQTLQDANKTKKHMVRIASQYLKDMRESNGDVSELTIFNKAGRISDKRTYGRDPEKTKG
jgi:hypothetical protein